MTENEISKIIVEEAIHIHKSIGPGMLESAYTQCLRYRLLKRNLDIKSEVAVPLLFEEVKLECGYRADLVIENKVVIEVKRIETIAPIHPDANINLFTIFKPQTWDGSQFQFPFDEGRHKKSS